MKLIDNIAILGFGVEGRSVAHFLRARGVKRITICDRDENLVVPEGLESCLGENYLADLERFEVIFRSPGISCLRPEIVAARAAGVKVTSALAYFLENCQGRTIGVTGTKGKGTTSSLIYDMLVAGGREPGKEVFLGGNIGNSPLDFLEKVNENAVVVLELSSFQVQDLEKSVDIAVVLNTTVDHLDYHKDIAEYWEAKKHLLKTMSADSLAILNKDYEYFADFKTAVRGKLKVVSAHDKANGAYLKDGEFVLGEEAVAKVSEMKMLGPHNVENILPALVVAGELGVNKEKMAYVIRNFQNLEHRLELVETVNGVRYVNDSYSTNTQTSIAAVASFDLPTVLLAGGHDKGLDYNEWARQLLLRENLRGIVLFGATADKMETALAEAHEELGAAQEARTMVLRRGNFEEAFDAGRELAEKFEEAVFVMSPAAASFGEFKNYKERGERFRGKVRGNR